MTAPLTPNWSCSPTLKPPVQPGCRMRRSSSIAISSLRRTRAIPRLSPRRSLRRCAANDAMDDAADTAQVIIRPPLAWELAVIAGLALDWLVPLPFLPAGLAAGWLGAMVFVLTLALLAWAIVTITRGGSQPADHRHRRERTVPLHAQPHLPRPVPGSDRLGHCVRQSLAADHAGALRPRHLLRRSGPRGSLSRAQVRRCLPWLPLACTALAVARATRKSPS